MCDYITFVPRLFCFWTFLKIIINTYICIFFTFFDIFLSSLVLFYPPYNSHSLCGIINYYCSSEIGSAVILFIEKKIQNGFQSILRSFDIQIFVEQTRFLYWNLNSHTAYSRLFVFPINPYLVATMCLSHFGFTQSIFVISLCVIQVLLRFFTWIIIFINK